MKKDNYKKVYAVGSYTDCEKIVENFEKLGINCNYTCDTPDNIYYNTEDNSVYKIYKDSTLGKMILTHPDWESINGDITFKYKVGDKVKTDVLGPECKNNVYTIVSTHIIDGKPHYNLNFVQEDVKMYISESNLEPLFASITDIIKTFEDACDWCEKYDCNSRVLVAQYKYIKEKLNYYVDDAISGIISYLKLRIITCALNEGWKPKYPSEFKYQVKLSKPINAPYTGVYSSCGPKELFFKSCELAEYAGKQFIDIYREFLM